MSDVAAELTALRVANARLKRDLANVRQQHREAASEWVDRIGHLTDERDEYRAQLDMCREDRDALQARYLKRAADLTSDKGIKLT